jgi:hypothetical protein
MKLTEFNDLCRSRPQSHELTRGPPELVQHFRLQGEFTSAMHVLNLIWFGDIPSQWEGGR